MYAKNSSGDSWTEIYRYNGYTGQARSAQQDWVHVFHVNSTIVYKNFALVGRVIEAGQQGSPGISIKDWELYGHEEGSASLDTTLKSVYNVPATTGTQLKVYYDAKGESTVQSPIPDLSPNTNTGAVVGHSPTLDETDGIESFKFNGSSQYINAGNIGVTAGSGEYPHSMSAWIKIDTLTSTMALTQIGSNPVSAGNTSIFYINALGNIILDIGGGGNTEWYSGLLTNQWYHVSYTYNGGASGRTPTSYKLYINGVDQGHQDTGAGSGTLNLVSGSTLVIGHRFTGNFFDGSVANFRHYSKILNTDQIKELYDYQKDYFLGSKSQVTLYKGHLGVGVTEPSGQLELAGDERIQEYPPRALTGYETLVEGHGVFCAYASSYYSNWYPWIAYNRNTDNTRSWHSEVATGMPDTFLDSNTTYSGSSKLGEHLGAWNKLKLPYKVNLKSFNITNRYDGTNITQSPIDFKILGSNDDINWEQIFSVTGESWPASTNTTKSYSITPNSNTYKYLAFMCTRIGGGTDVIVNDIRYFGTPGPTTLDKGSLTLGRSLDVPRVSRYDVDTETPRPEKLVLDLDTTVNSSPTDISGKGNHGTMVGATYSPADKAFTFGGSNNVIHNTSLNPVMTGDVITSMSCWFKVDNSTTRQTVMWIGSNAANAYFIDIRIKGGYIGLSMAHDPDTNMLGIKYTDQVLESNRWYHVVGVKSGTGAINSSTTAGMLQLYLDGVKLNTVDGGLTDSSGLNIPTDHNQLTIGAGNENGTAAPFAGQISNPKLYSVALEPSEVQKLYRLGRTGRSMVISDTAVGIGKVPEAQLDVRGNLNVDGVITNQQRPAFYVWRDGTGLNVEAIGHGGQNRLAVTGVITNWDSKRVDTAGTFDLSNGRYYIPVSGLYMLIGAGVYRWASGNGILEASFYVNGSNVGPRGISYNRGNTSNEHHTVTITFMRFMNAGDYVQMGVPVAQSACDLYYGDNLGYFSGYLLG